MRIALIALLACVFSGCSGMYTIDQRQDIIRGLQPVVERTVERTVDVAVDKKAVKVEKELHLKLTEEQKDGLKEDLTDAGTEATLKALDKHLPEGGKPKSKFWNTVGAAATNLALAAGATLLKGS